MKSAPHCATPELMALLCLMGGAVREAMAAHLLVQLMLVGVFNPAFGAVFKTWLHAEERAHAAGDASAWYDLGEDDDPQDDPEDDFDETRIVPFGRMGLALVWRHVTRFGTVMVVKLAEMSDEHPASVPVMRLGCVALAGLSGPSQFLFFWLDLVDGKTCVLIVPYS